ncbi:MAG: aconitate hydratase, partial [Desulfonatronovibrionaceae bacterium]
ALGPRYLGVRIVLVKSFARIHRANLVNFGILPLTLVNPADYDQLGTDRTLSLDTSSLQPGAQSMLSSDTGPDIPVKNDLTAAELNIIKAGGLLNHVRSTKTGTAG